METKRVFTPDAVTLVLITLVGAAMVLGGGGSDDPQTEALLQLVFAGTAIVALIHPRVAMHLKRPPWIILAIGAIVLALPIVQLVPLPPAVWQALPGRELEKASLDVVGAGQTWMPLSMVPPRTFATLLAAICPVVLMMFVSSAATSARVMVALAIVIVGLASIFLGMLQIAHVGGYSWLPYISVPKGWLTGFQAGRNAEADILNIAIVALAYAVLAGLRNGQAMRSAFMLIGGGVALFTIAVLSTGSRTGLTLMLVALLAGTSILWPQLRRTTPDLRLWLVGGTVIVATALAGLSRIGAVQRVAQRFFATTDARFSYWVDTLAAIRKMWPAGSGMSTFPMVFQTYERLEMVTPMFTPRAHNDWLELMMESGIAGVVALLATGALLVKLVIAAWRSIANADDAQLRRGEILFGIGILVILGLHSIDDYPLRSMSLACMAALAIGLISPYQTLKKTDSTILDSATAQG